MNILPTFWTLLGALCAFMQGVAWIVEVVA